MVEMVEIVDGRVGKRSVERLRYVINNLLHLVIVKYRTQYFLRLVTILTLLVNLSYFTLTRVISLIQYITEISIGHPGLGLASSPN